MLRWDIFCKVIDNFGDIGVSWRLARQLSSEYGQNVRLWVDDLSALAAIEPQIDANLDMQNTQEITVMYWSKDFDWATVTVADVVIEAFACALPAPYLNAIVVRKALTGDAPYWINLEYLTAEAWADGCHLMASPQSGGLSKVFFFPGFSEKTGGLLRERNLFIQRDALNKQKKWSELTGFDWVDHGLKITLFGYQRMPLVKWLPCLVAADQPIQLAVTSGQAAVAMQNAWQRLGYAENGVQGALSVRFLPTLAQKDFDALLWSSDFNCVRGEDSWIRAIWAAVPFVWHIYEQDDGVHMDKLEAFITRYCAFSQNPQASDAWANWQRFWNGNERLDTAMTWRAFMCEWPSIQSHASQQSNTYAQIEDLAQQLARHCGVSVQKSL